MVWERVEKEIQLCDKRKAGFVVEEVLE